LLRNALSSAKILTAERERELLVRYQANQDKGAMDELVRSHMPIIFRVAGRSARNPRVDINDLVQTATEGLLVAINRWSFEKSDASGMQPIDETPSGKPQPLPPPGAQSASSAQDASPAGATPALPRSSRLATYAIWWMRILLTNSVIESRGMIVRAKSPKARMALFNLPLAINKLGISLPLSGSDIGRIATYLGVGQREIEEALVHAAGDVMLDQPIGDTGVLCGDVTPDDRAEGEDGILNRLAAADRWDAVCEALMDLPPRERFILITRYLLSSKWKLDRLSDTLKISRERIRQIATDSLRQIERRVGSQDVRHDPSRSHAPAQAQALVHAIESASMSSDPAGMKAFLKKHQVATGPKRVTRRRLAATKAASNARSLHLPALAPEMHLIAA